MNYLKHAIVYCILYFGSLIPMYCIAPIKDYPSDVYSSGAITYFRILVVAMLVGYSYATWKLSEWITNKD